MISDRIEAFLADKGYDADAIRDEIASAKVEAVIPSKSNRREPIPHDKAKYKWRNQIERLFNKLKNWRRVATRCRNSSGVLRGPCMSQDPAFRKQSAGVVAGPPR
jgi:transposase